MEEGIKRGRPFISYKRYMNIKDKLNSMLHHEDTVSKILDIICNEVNYDPKQNTYEPRMKENMRKYRENLKIRKLNDISK